MNNFKRLQKNQSKFLSIVTMLLISLVASILSPSIAFASDAIGANVEPDKPYSNPSKLSAPEVEVDQAEIAFSVIDGKNTITATSSSPATSDKPLSLFSGGSLYTSVTSGNTIQIPIYRTESSYYATYGTSTSPPLKPFAADELWSVSISSDKQIYKQSEQFTISGTVVLPDNYSAYSVYLLDKDDNIILKSDDRYSYTHTTWSNDASAGYYAVIADNLSYSEYIGKKKDALTGIKSETEKISLTKNAIAISMSIDKNEIKVGERAYLTPKLSYPLASGIFQIYFVDTTSGDIVQRQETANMSPMPAYLYNEGSPKKYKAYLANKDNSVYRLDQLTGILAESNEIEVTRTPWSISLDKSNSPFKVGEYGKISWETNQDTAIGDNSKYYVAYIYDKTSGAYYNQSDSLHQGSMDITFHSGDPHEYVVFIAKNLSYENIPWTWDPNDPYPDGLEEIQATSNSVSIARMPWDVSLSANTNNLKTDEEVKFTVTTNQSDAWQGRYYRAAIVDVSTGAIISHSSTGKGTLPANFTNLFPEAGTHEYKVYIGNIPYNSASNVSEITEIQAVSNSIFVTRAPWTVKPKTTIYTQNYEWYQEPLHFYDMKFETNQYGNYYEPYTARLFDITAQEYLTRSYWGGYNYTVMIETKNQENHEYKWVFGTFETNSQDYPTLIYQEAVSPSFTLRSSGGPTDLFETSGGSNPSEECNQGCHGDPVNAATGEFWDSQQDLVIAQNGPLLGFVRSFATSKKDQDKGLGYGWTHNYDMTLRGLNSDGTAHNNIDTAAKVSVVQENGAESIFTKMSNGSYQAPLRVKAILTKTPNGIYTFTRKNNTSFSFTQDGKLSSIKDKNNNVISLAYTDDKLTKISNSRNQYITITWVNNRISKVEDHSGRIFKYNYDSNGQLTSTENPMHTIINYTYDDSHKVLSLQNNLGGITTNTYIGDKIATQLDPKNNLLKFSYLPDSSGSTTSIGYPDGSVVDERYDKTQQLVQTTTTKNGSSSVERFKYSADGSLWAVTNAGGYTSYFTYDADGNMVSSQDAIGYVTQMTYDSEGKLLTTRNANGDVATNTYDNRGNPLSSTSYEGRKNVYTVNPDGSVATSISEKGNVDGANANEYTTTYGYNSFGYLISMTDAIGSVSILETDSLGKVVKTVSPEGNVLGNDPNDYDSTIEYDAIGNIVSATDIKGNVSSSTYDAMGNVLKSTNALGKETSFTYDVVGNLLTAKDALGQITTYSYDSRNRLVKITDPANKVSEIFYDNFGNVNKTKDALGRESTQIWDGIGQLVSSTDPDGKKTEYTYDPNGVLLTSKDPLGNTSTYTYDPLGRLSTSKNAENHVSTLSYTKDSLISSALRADGLTESSAYDIAGNAISSTDAAGKTQTWDYDNLNRKISYTNAVGNVESYSYGLSNQLLTSTRTDGSIVGYQYDKQNLLTNVDYPGLDMDVSYTYDALSRKVSEQKGSEPAISYAYDDIGHLVSRGPPNQKVTYTYDAIGNMSSMTYPSGRVVNYDYDDASQLTSLETANIGVASYTYNNKGLPSESTLASGVKTSWSYNDAGRSTGFTVKNNTDAELYKKEYSFTPTGNISQQEETGAIPNLSDFIYDPLSRLTEQKKNADSTVVNAYAYNAIGNLTSNNTVTQTFDDAGKILSSGNKTFGYDNRGNRLTTGDSATTETTDNTWNEADLLISQEVVKNGATVDIDYTYGADGLLASRFKNGQSSNSFVWDISSSIPLLLDDGINEYIYGVGRTPIAQIVKVDGSVTYLHADSIGSVTASSSSDGELVASTSYSPYGVNLGLRISSFGFAGEWTDPDTNHSYLRARWLDTTTGTFLSRDPLVQSTGDGYGYAAGNPLSMIDPLGLAAFGGDAFAFMDTQGFQNLTNFVGGFGDAVTMGGTKGIRQATGINTVQECSGFYTTGEWAGVAATSVSPFGVAKGAGTTVWASFKEGATFAKWMAKNSKNYEHGSIPSPVNAFEDFNNLRRQPIDITESIEWSKKFREGILSGKPFGKYGKLNEAKKKSKVQGGGMTRDRYIDKKNRIYEFDYQHGRIERYDRFGKHLGENYLDGSHSGNAKSNRKVMP